MVINPFDFFVEEYAEHFPFAYEPRLAADLAPYLRPVDDSAAAALVAGGAADSSTPRRARRSVDVPRPASTSAVHARRRLRRPHGARRADARRDAGPRRSARAATAPGCWCSLLRQLRPRRPVRLRLPRAARRRPRGRSTGPSGPTEDFTDLHAWAEVYIPGAGWVGLDPTCALFAGEGHIPLSATPHPRSAAPDQRADRAVEVTLRLPQRGHPHPRGPARHQALHRRAVGRASTRSASAVDERLRRRRRPADDGRRADLRRARRHGQRRVEHRRRRRGQARARQPRWPSGCARAYAARRRSCTAARASGTPGEPLPRWHIALHGAPTACRCGSDPALLADPWDARGRPDAPPSRPRRSPGGHRRRSACPPSSCCRRTRTRSPRSPPRSASPTGRAPDEEPRRRRRRRARRRRVTEPTASAWVLPAAHRRRRATAGPSPAVEVPPRPAGADPRATRRSACACRSTRSSWDGPRAAPGEPSYLEAGPPAATRRASAHASTRRRPARRRAADRARASRRATATSTSSCRRLDDLEDVRRPARALVEDAAAELGGAASCSRATRRRRTRGSPSSIGHPRPRRHRGQRPADRVAGPSCATSPRRSTTPPAQAGLGDREVRPRRPAHRHRRRQPPHPRRPAAGRLAAAAPARPAAQPAHLLAAPPVAVLPVLRPLHRPDQPGAALRRGPARGGLRAGDRLRRDRAAGARPRTRASVAAVARRPRAAAPAHRPHRQHPPRRVLHRQALQPRHRARPARPARAARLRDAAAPADGAGPGAARPRAWSRCSGRALPRPLVRWGTELHERLPAARGLRPPTSPRSCADLRAHGIAVRGGVARRRSSSSASRASARRTSAGVELELRQADRAVARARRGGRPRGGTARYVDSSVERLQVAGHAGSIPGRHLVTCNGVPVPLRPTGRHRRRTSPVSATAPGSRVGAAPDDRGPRPAALRRRRHSPPSALWAAATYHVVHPGGRAYDATRGQRQRGRGPPGQPVRGARPHAGRGRRRRRCGGRGAGAPGRPELPAHPRPARVTCRAPGAAEACSPDYRARTAPALALRRAASGRDGAPPAGLGRARRWTPGTPRACARRAAWRARLLEDDGVTYNPPPGA